MIAKTLNPSSTNADHKIHGVSKPQRQDAGPPPTGSRVCSIDSLGDSCRLHRQCTDEQRRLYTGLCCPACLVTRYINSCMTHVRDVITKIYLYKFRYFTSHTFKIAFLNPHLLRHEKILTYHDI